MTGFFDTLKGKEHTLQPREVGMQVDNIGGAWSGGGLVRTPDILKQSESTPLVIKISPEDAELIGAAVARNTPSFGTP